MGEGELGTELSLLPKNRSGSGEVDSAGTFRSFSIFADFSGSAGHKVGGIHFIHLTRTLSRSREKCGRFGNLA